MQLEIKKTKAKDYTNFTDGKYVSFIPENDSDVFSIGKATALFKNHVTNFNGDNKITSFDVDYNEFMNNLFHN